MGFRVFGCAALLASVAACGSGKVTTADTGRVQFLFFARQPLAGSLAAMPEPKLLSLGRRACTSMNAHMTSDQIVADIGGNPEPGSADFNAYSFIVVDAAMHLCPSHRGEFSNLPAG